jgi:hypothetical protein
MRETGMHASTELITRYVAGDSTIGAHTEWALEAHLESCPVCRARLAEVTSLSASGMSALVDQGWRKLAPVMAVNRPAPARRFRVSAWVTPAMAPWLCAAVFVALLAVAFGSVPDAGSVLFLLAPVVPVLGVAAAWSRGLDPMYELTVSTPRAGLALVLRRTAAVLVAVLPLLAAGSVLVGVSPLVWLLPGLACTLTSLALGSVIGVERAALGVCVVWLLVFLAPVVARLEVLPATAPWSVPVWGGASFLAGAALVARGRALTTLGPGFDEKGGR